MLWGLRDFIFFVDSCLNELPEAKSLFLVELRKKDKTRIKKQEMLGLNPGLLICE